MSIEITYITGAAGTGKTYLLRERMIELGPAYAKACATTGVAAMNLGTTTLHSLLKVFKPEDFKTRRNKIFHILDDLAVSHIIIDESSMLDMRMFEGLVELLDEYGDIDLILAGDFAQLPPVDGCYIFQSKLWERVRIEKLEKIYRQDNEKFLLALKLARQGLGPAAAKLLKELCEFRPVREFSFPGICLVATKKEAFTFNNQNMAGLEGDLVPVSSQRWGKQLSEWKDIPDIVSFKTGCRVRIRANDTKDSRWSYVNGDTGRLEITGANSGAKYNVLLDRTGEQVTVNQVIRFNDISENEIDEDTPTKTRTYRDESGTDHQQNYIGSVRFLPLEPGYASSTHSAQGLTLDSAQISLAGLNQFLFARGFGYNLAYVALSRLRSPERLRIHGSPQELGGKIKIDPRVNQWI